MTAISLIIDLLFDFFFLIINHLPWPDPPRPQEGGKAIADYASGMDFGMALGPLIGWSIVHFSLPTYLIFLAGTIFYILGALITRDHSATMDA